MTKTIKQKTGSKEDISAGGDLGVRSFLIIYSQNNTFSICNTECQKYIKKHFTKIDKINQILNMSKNNRRTYSTVTVTKALNDIDDYHYEEINRRINRTRLKKALRKYHQKIKDKIADMHFKTAFELVNTFDNIYLGNLSTSEILSRNNKTISKSTKRMLQALSPYAFKQRMIYMGNKYGCKSHL